MNWYDGGVGPWTTVDWRDARVGEAALDPYLVWAEYSLLGARSPDRVPVMIEVREDRSAALFIEHVLVHLPHDVQVADVYRQPARGLAATRYLTANVTPRFFGELSASLKDWVARVDYGAPIAPSASRPCMSFPPSQQLTSGPLPELVAIIDDGIAFAHERFRTSAGNQTRFESFWNQDSAYALHPPGFGYGAEIDFVQVNRMLGTDRVDEDLVYAAAGYRHVRRRATHGTHVLDMASGFDAPAPRDAQPLIGVQLPGAVVRDTSGMGLGIHILDGMRYILDRAAGISNKYVLGRRAECPVLVNISYATLGGPHDGSGMLEQALDELIEAREPLGKLTVTLPAGNHYQARCHAAFDLDTDQQRSLTWKVLPDDKTPSFLEIWCQTPSTSTGSRFELEVETPAGHKSGAIGLGEVRMLGGTGAPSCVVTYLHRVSRGDGTMILVALAPTASLEAGQALAPFGLWRISVRNLGARATVNAWISRDESLLGYASAGRQSRFEDPDYERWDALGRPATNDNGKSYIQREGTLNGLAGGGSTVVVGAYRDQDRQASDYSASGDARRGVDAMAVADDSLVSRGRLGAGSRSGSTVAINGTSVAAPQALRLLTRRPGDQGRMARAAVSSRASSEDIRNTQARPARASRAAHPPGARRGGGRLTVVPTTVRRRPPR